MTDRGRYERGRYKRAAHAMQSGVAQEMEMPERSKATDPKHLRVGINVAMVDHSALVTLLIAKGVLTEDEYLAAIADAMEQEKSRYEASLSEALGIKVTLA
jgi:hypothetical protein